MRYPLNNQVALITGAGSGIGRQLALELSGYGAVIAALDLRVEPLEGLITELKARNGAGGWEVADVTDRGALWSAVASFTRRLGPIGLLVANAGIRFAMPAADFKAEDLDKHLRVNLVGAANSIEAVLPGMLERRRGHLVAISSLASYRGVPRMSGYGASKAGVNALMDSLRVELRPLGIACTTICPGWVRTPLTADVAVPAAEMMAVEEAARLIARAIVKRKPFYAFPRRRRIPLALIRLLPTRLGDWLIRRITRRWDRMRVIEPPSPGGEETTP